MRLYIRLFKLALILAICFVGFTTHEVSAKQQLASQFAITNAQRSAFAQNNILFYDPDDCVGSGGGNYNGSLCGDTAIEKYWSALTRHFTPEVAAGILGNMIHEGGFNPVSVESCIDARNPYNFDTKQWGANGWESFDFWWTHDSKTNDPSDSTTTTGVGSFAITSGRASGYLAYIEAKDSSMKQYFMDPGKYAYSSCTDKTHMPYEGEFPGDAFLKVVGEKVYDELVELEVEYAVNTHIPSAQSKYGKFDMEHFKGLGVEEAARYFASHYEQCKYCDTESVQSERAESARTYYEQLKGSSCTAKSINGSNNSIVNLRDSITNATIIGDSISVQSREELMSKFPAGFVNAVGGRSSTWGGMCTGDVGGKAVIETIINGGTVWNQTALSTGDAECGTVDVNVANLNKNVVWALGANADASEVLVTEQTVNDVLGLIGNRNLFLVLPYNGKDLSVSDDIDKIYQSIANNHDNVFVIDWAGEVKKDPEKYISTDDGMAVHPTEDGKRLYAELIYQKVNNQEVSDGDDCGTVVERAGQKIADIAKKLSCSESNDSDCKKKKTEAYEEAREKWGFSGGLEAVKFVETVILESGQDESFAIVKPGDAAFEEGGNQNYRNLKNLNEYFQSNKDLYLELSDDSGLMPGDIIISAGGSGEGNDAMIYIGDGKVARAERSGRVSYWPTIKQYKSQSYYRKYRNKKEETKATGSCSMCDDGSGGGGELISGGMTKEQVESRIMPEYMKANPGDYNFVSDDHGCTHCNCVNFSKWFVKKYLGMPLESVSGYISESERDASGNPGGGAFANAFLNKFKKEYPDLTISNTPTPYSIASCGLLYFPGGVTPSHTYIVFGVDSVKKTMVLGEANYNGGIEGIKALELPVDGTDPYHNGEYNNKKCRYVDVSGYVKSGA